MESIESREATIAQIAGLEDNVAVLRAHLHEIVEGDAFKSSSRCIPKVQSAEDINQVSAPDFRTHARADLLH